MPLHFPQANCKKRGAGATKLETVCSNPLAMTFQSCAGRVTGRTTGVRAGIKRAYIWSDKP